jgi:hypothetical protein
MVFYAENLWFVVPGLFVFCFLLDAFIWWMNQRWLRLHPGKPRHPYSPLFTAIGVTGVSIGLAFLVPWQYAVISFGLYVVYGGLMWLLHARRWMLRA